MVQAPTPAPGQSPSRGARGLPAESRSRIELEQLRGVAPEHLGLVGGGKVSDERSHSFAGGAVGCRGRSGAEAAAIDQPLGSVGVGELSHYGADVTVRILFLAWDPRQLHDDIPEARPADDHRVLLRRALERPAEVIDKDVGIAELADQPLEFWSVAGFEVELDGQAKVGRFLPQPPQLRLAEG